MTEFIEPLFAHDEPGPRYTIADAARRLAEPGESPDVVATQLRGFAQRRLIHARGQKGSGRTAHNLFGAGDLAAAKILRTLTMFGIADNDTLQAASLGCYAWSEINPPPKGATSHPITHAVFGFARPKKDREYWSFQMDLFVNDQTGKRQFVVAVFNPAKSKIEYEPRSGFVPVGSVSIPIFRFCPAIVADHRGQN